MAEEEPTAHIYTIPIKDRNRGLRTERAKRAIKTIKSFIARHMDAKEDHVWIDGKLNELIWSRGGKKIPHRIRVRAIKFEDELVEVSLPEE